MGSVYKDLLAYGKGFPPSKHQTGSYDFVFSNTLRSRETDKPGKVIWSIMLDSTVCTLKYKERISNFGEKGEGTFSEVLKCQHVKDGTYYACKKMKQHYDGVDQVNNLREIQAMRRLNPHANIIGLHEIIYDKKTGTVALICELMDMNIYEMIRGRRHYLPEVKIKNYMYQLLKSLDHMHRCGIFHRDVKPENILIKDEVLKLADFGSCRSVYSKPPYTEYISTRWYRAPECLLTDGYYSYRMDLWSVGCVFFEVMSLHPLFPGSNEVDQIAKIHDVLGTPDASVLNKMKHRNRGINFDFPSKKGSGIEKLIPHASSQCIELIYKMCTYDPEERITAKQALRHSYFRDLRETDKKQAEAHRHLTEGSSVTSGATVSNTTAGGGENSSWRQNQIQKKRNEDLPETTADSAIETDFDLENEEKDLASEMLVYTMQQLPPIAEPLHKTVILNAISQKHHTFVDNASKFCENNDTVKPKRADSSCATIYKKNSATGFKRGSNAVLQKQSSDPTKATSRRRSKLAANFSGENGSVKIKNKEYLHHTIKKRKSSKTDSNDTKTLKRQPSIDQTKLTTPKTNYLDSKVFVTNHRLGGFKRKRNDSLPVQLMKGIVDKNFAGSTENESLSCVSNSKPAKHQLLDESDIKYFKVPQVMSLPQPEKSSMPTLPDPVAIDQVDRKRKAQNVLNMTYIVSSNKADAARIPYDINIGSLSIFSERLRTRGIRPGKKQYVIKVDAPRSMVREPSISPVNETASPIQQRRQRRLVEQQQKNTLAVKNQAGNSTDGLVKAPLPHLMGAGSTYGGAGPKSVYSTTLPKVHLPRHQFAHHQTSSNLLPGILKTNVLQPKTLHKTKIKQKEPKSIYGHNHYQLPAINRHVYHH